VLTLGRAHGILIIEDDAYYYLQYPRGPTDPPGLTALDKGSFLSLDSDGRVVR
jgi:kynurenine/2-aminoadipate aminotransferase